MLITLSVTSRQYPTIAWLLVFSSRQTLCAAHLCRIIASMMNRWIWARDQLNAQLNDKQRTGSDSLWENNRSVEIDTQLIWIDQWRAVDDFVCYDVLRKSIERMKWSRGMFSNSYIAMDLVVACLILLKTSLLFGCLRLKPPFSHPNDTNLYKLRCCWIFIAKKKGWMIFNFNSAMNFDLFSEMDFVLLLISNWTSFFVLFLSRTRTVNGWLKRVMTANLLRSHSTVWAPNAPTTIFSCTMGIRFGRRCWAVLAGKRSHNRWSQHRAA